eukprot:TRINITY_DN3476_c0_g1_i10.p1 TRINITY_DN3476_c0_g1~~TRINITY_DN3476_c0_g1_i10.p1  ORF type:complete len:203 (+),score=24.19 TRINITY_DN3476_c0_g1_i10:243-851(+)
MNHSSFQRALYTFSTPLYGQFNFRHQYEEFPKTTTVGAILMFDISNRASYKNTPNWYRNWMRIYEDSPLFLAATKTDDLQNRMIKARQITFHRKKNLTFCDISSYANYFIVEPLVLLARKIFKNNELSLVERPPLREALTTMSEEALNASYQTRASEIEQAFEDDDEDEPTIYQGTLIDAILALHKELQKLPVGAEYNQRED